MGGCYARDSTQKEPKEAKYRRQPEEHEYPGLPAEQDSFDPRPWEWTPVLKVAPASNVRSRESELRNREVSRPKGEGSGRTSPADSSQVPIPESTDPDAYLFDAEAWLEMAEGGELDIYTCLGLSDANTFSKDTRKLIVKIIAVSTLQLVVPCLMLYLQMLQGFSYRPLDPGRGFRLIGFVLYLYSLYSMYNNALDECRYRLLQYALQERLSSGFWWPLVLGEFSNTTVSFVLMFTLFFIYTNSRSAADLILNAVAVNFLGSVDSEFVDKEMLTDCCENFRALMDRPTTGPDGGHNASGWGKVTDLVLKTMLNIILTCGVSLSIVFLVVPSPPPDEIAKLLKHTATR
jgi:hypothetical protein